MCMLDPDAEESELPVCYNIRCRYHLLGEIRDGRIAYFHPLAAAAARHKPLSQWTDDDIMKACESLPESCAVDAGCDWGKTWDEVGAAIGVSGEAMRMLEPKMLRRLRPWMRAALRKLIDGEEERSGKKRLPIVDITQYQDPVEPGEQLELLV